MKLINQIRSKLLCVNKSHFYLSSIVDTMRHIKIVRNVLRRYKDRFSRSLNWKNPQLYSEKITLFQLSQEAEDLSNLADKYEVRKYIEKQIGAEYLIPLLGVYDSIDKIQIKALPNSFVLKATHGSGWNIFCKSKSKSKFDWSKEKKLLMRWMSLNYYSFYGERQYKNIKPRIICEKYIPARNGLTDYKFHYFNGKLHFIRAMANRYTHLRKGTYDLNWNKFPLTYFSHVGGTPYKNADIPRPNNLKGMIQIATKLSAPFPFVRVDLYENNNKIYFGELTFSPNAGLDVYSPDEYDKKYGSLMP